MARQGTVTIAISPSSNIVAVGEVFTLDIKIQAGSQPVDGAAAYIDFNPTYLVVVDASGNPATEIIPGSTLATVMQNNVDNNQGKIDYAAGLLVGATPSGGFTLATIRFKATAETTGTPLVFVSTPPRKTNVVYQGNSVLGSLVNGNVTISASPRRFLYLPLLMKNYTPGLQPSITPTATPTRTPTVIPTPSSTSTATPMVTCTPTPQVPLPDKFLFVIGAQAPVGQFNYPHSVAVAPDGTVYVADMDNNRIQRFSATGQFLGQWGFLGSGDGQFVYPDGIAVAPDSTVYVADTGNDRIQCFSATGQFLTWTSQNQRGSDLPGTSDS